MAHPSIPPTVSERRRRWPWVVAGIFLTLLLAGGIAYLALRHEATAHRHLPAGTRLALRADAQAMVTFRPVREHIWPLLFRARAEERSERIERIEQATGLRIPLDLREAVIASVDAQSWVLLVGGPRKSERFIPGMEEVLRDEGVAGWRREGAILVHRLGPSLAQADDGTIILGTDLAIVKASLPAHDDEDLPLPPEGAVSFVVHEDAYAGALARLPSLPGLDTLGKVRALTGTVTLGSAPQLSLSLEPGAGVAAAGLRDDLDRDLGRLRLAMALVPGELYGAREALSGRELSVEGERVRMVAPLPYAALDRAVKRLADRLAEGKPQPP